MKPINLGEANPARPSQKPTPDQLAAARAYVEREASDLLEMLFGRQS